MKKNFYCPNCDITWTAQSDKDGFYNGRGRAVCPVCGECGFNPSDYADYTCKYCGHKWRQYGNGGLVLGCTPRCPKCKC